MVRWKPTPRSMDNLRLNQAHRGSLPKQRANAIVVTVHVVSFCNKLGFLPGAFPSPSRRSLRDQPQVPQSLWAWLTCPSVAASQPTTLAGTRGNERSDAKGARDAEGNPWTPFLELESSERECHAAVPPRSSIKCRTNGIVSPPNSLCTKSSTVSRITVRALARAA